MNETGQKRAMLGGLFASIDAMDTTQFLSRLTPTAEFTFGSAPTVQGHAAIGEAVNTFFSTIAGLRHELTNTLEQDDIVACEGTVTYTRHDSTTIALPFADFFTFDAELIAGYRIYMDVGPLYVPAG